MGSATHFEYLTVYCIDNSQESFYNEDYSPTRWGIQLELLNICSKAVFASKNDENSDESERVLTEKIAVISSGGKPRVVIPPTFATSRISDLYKLDPSNGPCNLIESLKLALLLSRQFHTQLKVVAFVAGEVHPLRLRECQATSAAFRAKNALLDVVVLSDAKCLSPEALECLKVLTNTRSGVDDPAHSSGKSRVTCSKSTGNNNSSSGSGSNAVAVATRAGLCLSVSAGHGPRCKYFSTTEAQDASPADHSVVAPTAAVRDALTPQVLVSLTGTSERADGQSLTEPTTLTQARTADLVACPPMASAWKERRDPSHFPPLGSQPTQRLILFPPPPESLPLWQQLDPILELIQPPGTLLKDLHDTKAVEGVVSDSDDIIKLAKANAGVEGSDAKPSAASALTVSGPKSVEEDVSAIDSRLPSRASATDLKPSAEANLHPAADKTDAAAVASSTSIIAGEEMTGEEALPATDSCDGIESEVLRTLLSKTKTTDEAIRHVNDATLCFADATTASDTTSSPPDDPEVSSLSSPAGVNEQTDGVHSQLDLAPALRLCEPRTSEPPSGPPAEEAVKTMDDSAPVSQDEERENMSTRSSSPGQGRTKASSSGPVAALVPVPMIPSRPRQQPSPGMKGLAAPARAPGATQTVSPTRPTLLPIARGTASMDSISVTSKQQLVSPAGVSSVSTLPPLPPAPLPLALPPSPSSLSSSYPEEAEARSLRGRLEGPAAGEEAGPVVARSDSPAAGERRPPWIQSRARAGPSFDSDETGASSVLDSVMTEGHAFDHGSSRGPPRRAPSSVSFDRRDDDLDTLLPIPISGLTPAPFPSSASRGMFSGVGDFMHGSAYEPPSFMAYNVSLVIRRPEDREETVVDGVSSSVADSSPARPALAVAEPMEEAQKALMTPKSNGEKSTSPTATTVTRTRQDKNASSLAAAAAGGEGEGEGGPRGALNEGDGCHSGGCSFRERSATDVASPRERGGKEFDKEEDRDREPEEDWSQDLDQDEEGGEGAPDGAEPATSARATLNRAAQIGKLRGVDGKYFLNYVMMNVPRWTKLVEVRAGCMVESGEACANMKVTSEFVLQGRAMRQQVVEKRAALSRRLKGELTNEGGASPPQRPLSLRRNALSIPLNHSSPKHVRSPSLPSPQTFSSASPSSSVTAVMAAATASFFPPSRHFPARLPPRASSEREVAADGAWKSPFPSSTAIAEATPRPPLASRPGSPLLGRSLEAHLASGMAKRSRYGKQGGEGLSAEAQLPVSPPDKNRIFAEEDLIPYRDYTQGMERAHHPLASISNEVAGNLVTDSESEKKTFLHGHHGIVAAKATDTTATVPVTASSTCATRSIYNPLGTYCSQASTGNKPGIDSFGSDANLVAKLARESEEAAAAAEGEKKRKPDDAADDTSRHIPRPVNPSVPVFFTPTGHSGPLRSPNGGPPLPGCSSAVAAAAVQASVPLIFPDRRPGMLTLLQSNSTGALKLLWSPAPEHTLKYDTIFPADTETARARRRNPSEAEVVIKLSPTSSSFRCCTVGGNRVLEVHRPLLVVTRMKPLRLHPGDGGSNRSSTSSVSSRRGNAQRSQNSHSQNSQKKPPPTQDAGVQNRQDRRSGSGSGAASVSRQTPASVAAEAYSDRAASAASVAVAVAGVAAVARPRRPSTAEEALAELGRKSVAFPFASVSSGRCNNNKSNANTVRPSGSLFSTSSAESGRGTGALGIRIRRQAPSERANRQCVPAPGSISPLEDMTRASNVSSRRTTTSSLSRPYDAPVEYDIDCVLQKWEDAKPKLSQSRSPAQSSRPPAAPAEARVTASKPTPAIRPEPSSLSLASEYILSAASSPATSRAGSRGPSASRFRATDLPLTEKKNSADVVAVAHHRYCTSRRASGHRDDGEAGKLPGRLPSDAHVSSPPRLSSLPDPSVVPANHDGTGPSTTALGGAAAAAAADSTEQHLHTGGRPGAPYGLHVRAVVGLRGPGSWVGEAGDVNPQDEPLGGPWGPPATARSLTAESTHTLFLKTVGALRRQGVSFCRVYRPSRIFFYLQEDRPAVSVPVPVDAQTNTPPPMTVTAGPTGRVTRHPSSVSSWASPGFSKLSPAVRPSSAGTRVTRRTSEQQTVRRPTNPPLESERGERERGEKERERGSGITSTAATAVPPSETSNKGGADDRRKNTEPTLTVVSIAAGATVGKEGVAKEAAAGDLSGERSAAARRRMSYEDLKGSKQHGEPNSGNQITKCVTLASESPVDGLTLISCANEKQEEKQGNLPGAIASFPLTDLDSDDFSDSENSEGKEHPHAVSRTEVLSHTASSGVFTILASPEALAPRRDATEPRHQIEMMSVSEAASTRLPNCESGTPSTLPFRLDPTEEASPPVPARGDEGIQHPSASSSVPYQKSPAQAPGRSLLLSEEAEAARRPSSALPSSAAPAAPSVATDVEADAPSSNKIPPGRYLGGAAALAEEMQAFLESPPEFKLEDHPDVRPSATIKIGPIAPMLLKHLMKQSETRNRELVASAAKVMMTAIRRQLDLSLGSGSNTPRSPYDGGGGFLSPSGKTSDGEGEDEGSGAAAEQNATGDGDSPFRSLPTSPLQPVPIVVRDNNSSEAGFKSNRDPDQTCSAPDGGKRNQSMSISPRLTDAANTSNPEATAPHRGSSSGTRPCSSSPFFAPTPTAPPRLPSLATPSTSTSANVNVTPKQTVPRMATGGYRRFSRHVQPLRILRSKPSSSSEMGASHNGGLDDEEEYFFFGGRGGSGRQTACGEFKVTGNGMKAFIGTAMSECNDFIFFMRPKNDVDRLAEDLAGSAGSTHSESGAAESAAGGGEEKTVGGRTRQEDGAHEGGGPKAKELLSPGYLVATAEAAEARAGALDSASGGTRGSSNAFFSPSHAAALAEATTARLLSSGEIAILEMRNAQLDGAAGYMERRSAAAAGLGGHSPGVSTQPNAIERIDDSRPGLGAMDGATLKRAHETQSSVEVTGGRKSQEAPSAAYETAADGTLCGAVSSMSLSATEEEARINKSPCDADALANVETSPSPSASDLVGVTPGSEGGPADSVLFDLD